MKSIGYVIATVVGLIASFVVAIILIWGANGGWRASYGIIVLFAVVHFFAYLFADKWNERGSIELATFALISPPVIVVCGWLIITKANSLFVSIATEKSFTDDCKTAGVQYIQLPSRPAHSLAYDWGGSHGPDVDLYELTSGNRIGSIGGFNKPIPAFDKAIEFIERKRDDRVGVSAPYVRFKGRDFQGIVDLTADVLVTYRFIHPEELSKAPINQGSVGYDLTVTDRRDGRKIAAMRYFVDRRSRRICGPIKDNVLSEKAFLAKALGLN